MADLPPGARGSLQPYLCAVMQSTVAGGNVKRAGDARRHFERWIRWCRMYNQCPTLENLSDPFPFLACYAYGYRCGELAAGGSVVRARTAEDAIRLIGQTIENLGHGDPRYHGRSGKMDKRFTRLWRDWRHYDDPPRRVKPIPLPVLLEAQRLADESGSIALQTTARLMWIAFYYLCRPGEHCATVDSNHFFRMCDVSLFIGAKLLDLAQAPDAGLLAASSSMLEFTDQKNSNRGEKVTQCHSGHPVASVTRALAHQIIHLRNNGAAPETPLCAYMHGDNWYLVTPPMLTNLLRQAAARVGGEFGIRPEDISARSLRASGAMAMLCAGIDPVKTQLMGRWRSDAMLLYLHVQSPTLVRDFARRMLDAGNFSLLPGSEVHKLVHNVQSEQLYLDD